MLIGNRELWTLCHPWSILHCLQAKADTDLRTLLITAIVHNGGSGLFTGFLTHG